MNIPSNTDDNLKEQATRQIIELGCSIEDVAKDTGICKMTLYRWAQEYVQNTKYDKG